ncbi:MAG: hypothetical protein GC179_14365 [Anaerolineaceae bacterium]|nr:hypothetical protein [Anaerolineaceae bacterium]
MSSTDKPDLIEHYSQFLLDYPTARLIAHDVRNRLNTIMLASDILPEEIQETDGDPLKYLALIQQAGREIIAILDAAMAAAANQDDSNTTP